MLRFATVLLDVENRSSNVDPSYSGAPTHVLAANVGGFPSHTRIALTTAISGRDEEALY
jgi:hypothetical protein